MHIQFFATYIIGTSNQYQQTEKGQKPDFKLHMFAGLCNTLVSLQVEVLQAVIDGEHVSLNVHNYRKMYVALHRIYSLPLVYCTGSRKMNEIKKITDLYRAMERVRRAFMKVTKCISWEEATRKYPEHTTDDRLKEFVKVALDKIIPPSFIAFCQTAIDGNSPRTETSVNAIQVHGSYISHFSCNFQNLFYRL